VRHGRLFFWEKVIVFIVSFFLVLFFGVHFRIWSIQWTVYLFRAEKWIELVFVFCVATGITMLFSKILQWHFRFERTH